MPHPLHHHRAALNKPIGALEEMIAELQEIALATGNDFTVARALAGLEQARTTLEDAVAEIDDFEEDPEHDEPEPESDDEPDDEEDEDA